MNVNDLFDMSGRAAVVTGGGTHLGRAMATALGELGAAVYIASRRGELCEQVAAELREQGIDCRGLACDATVEDQVQELVARVVAERGRIDVMVCNAGSQVTTANVPDVPVDEFRQTHDLNVTSAFICAQVAARAMIPNRYGRIVTVGSIHGSLGSDPRFYEGLDYMRSGPPYQSAKGAVINLTRGLAAEFGRYGITVNCISPGQIPGPGTDPRMVERSRLANALGTVGEPVHLKGAVALLASDAGGWITGHNLVVDGGWSIW